MIAATPWKIPRGVRFLAFNILVMLFAVIFLLTPVLVHFAGRSEEISETATQLAHFRKILRNASMLNNKSSQGGDPFLPGSEERIASADLQASLKALATNAGVSLLVIRGLEGSRFPQMRMVAVSVEVEGSLTAVRDLVASIESQTPFLFVTAASFRSVNEGEEGPIRAELKVQGAIRNIGSSGATDAVSR